MGLVKCILAGAFSLVGAAFSLTAIFLISASASAPTDEAIAIDVYSVVKSSPRLWVLGALAFMLGFLWERRRLKSRPSK